MLKELARGYYLVIRIEDIIKRKALFIYKPLILES